MQIRISHIDRGSLHDGPGLRDVVYFRGCPLRCLWCHNPETFFGDKHIVYANARCVGCGRCVAVCPSGCHTEGEDGHIYDRQNCKRCLRCADACPSGALSASGEDADARNIAARLARDKAYYDATGGGVTLSGGECLMQSEAAAELLNICQSMGLHMAIESALCVDEASVRRVLGLCDLFIVDIKLFDAGEHRLLTGKDNALILRNVRLLARAATRLWVRTPIIPGFTDRRENLLAIADFLRELGGGVERYELLRYNDLSVTKYKGLDLPYALADLKPQSDAEMDALTAIVAHRIGNATEVIHS